ncbi:MAG TPA: TonB-dependent receptor plug domain-containing protein, partial [Alphaproteobacteria bacterium]|nr:TonB-dependent receptor plug domain-containing protein [Alphaproteobacteria bacterium]
MSSKWMLALCATVGIVGLSGAHRAVAQADQQTAAPAGAEGMEEIVVTARRKEERLQSVPLAITAFSQNDLEKNRIQSVRDLGRTVPSLAISNSQSDANAPYSSQTRLRGLPGSVIYFADVPLGTTDYDTSTGLTHGLSSGFYFDLDTLQVLKGPQGTLFGKNSIGGLISIQPKKPTNNFEGYAQVTFGNYGDKEFEGAVNIPVVEDKLMVRIAGMRQERDGYTTDYYTGKDYDNRDNYSWRIGVTFRPTDDFENYFVYDGYYQDSNGSSTILRYVNPDFALAKLGKDFKPLHKGTPGNPGNGPCTATVTLGGPAVSAGTVPGGCLSPSTLRIGLYPGIEDLVGQQQQLGARTELGHAVQGIGKDYFYGFTDTATWDIADELTLKNIASARVFKQLSTTDDFGAGNLPILNVGVPGNNQQWGDNSVHYTEELQLQGKSLDDKLDWVVGGYLEYDHPLGDTLLGSTAVGNTSYYHFNETARSQALFAHGIYDLSDYVDGLRFTAGYRYTWDHITAEERATTGVDGVVRNGAGVAQNCGVSSGVDQNCHISAGGDFSSFGWNVGLDEQLDSKTLVYVRSGNAYRPGGFNLNVPAENAKFQPEHVTDVEIGVKADWDLWGMHARTNADIFHTDYKDIQTTRLVQVKNADGSSRVASLLFNAADASLEGAEFEASFVPVEGVEIAPHLSYLYTEYGKYPADAQAGSSNPPFLYTPKLQYAVTGTYHLPIDESWGDIALSATYSWYGHQYLSVQAGEIYPIMPSYENLDLRVDWTNVMGNPVDVAFFMTNAQDNTHVVGGFPIYTQLGFTSLVYNEPRMWGFTMKYRFGGPSEPE